MICNTLEKYRAQYLKEELGALWHWFLRDDQRQASDI